MKEETCCFTGHRKIESDQYPVLTAKLEEVTENLILSGYRYFGTGGALGFDTLAAQTVLKLKIKYPQIKLILVLPCVTQADRWDAKNKTIYESIKRKADKIVYVSKEYVKGCMLERNRHLVDNSSVCVCYLTENTGGTAYTVKYAVSRGVRVININTNNGAVE